VNLKRHLARLKQRAGAAPTRPNELGAGAAGSAADTAAEPPVDSAADRPAHPKEQTLAELRQRMNELLGKPVATRRPEKPQIDFEDLGFSRHDNPLGQCWVRSRRLAPSTHVGRVSVTEVGAIDTRVLSLLALDPSLADCRFEGALLLDTETTGLGGGAGTYAFLVGLCRFEAASESSPSGWVVEQLLLEGPEQEPALLHLLGQRIDDSAVLITFNGKSFDWPLIETRFVMNGLPGVRRLPHLDLLHVSRRVHRYRLQRCNLKHLESQVLGFEREGDVEGAEVASRYTHYLRSGDVEPLSAVIEHNYWDVISMGALVALYGEPLPALDAQDLLGLAHAFKRAGALSEAMDATETALGGGAGAQALHLRAQIHAARGDRLAALGDLESADAELDDPKLRLQLAKLYEHVIKRPDKALALLERGLSESELAIDKRRQRLLRKLQRR